MDAAERIGEYEVVAEVGRGGMGVVYEVRHPSSTRRLALKLIHAHMASPDALTRFGREAELLARVRHAGVVTIHSLGSADKGPFMVMDYLEGEDLKSLCAQGPRPPEEAARIVAEVADAVSALHGAQILHRDLKPANVLLDAASGRPILLDFGIARGMDADQLTRTGDLVGSPAYMSPEQANGMSPSRLDARTDVYGLGTILFTLLAGKAPFAESGSMVTTLKRVLTEAPTWPTAPAPLRAILKQAMAKDRLARYPTAAALCADLKRYLAGESVRALEGHSIGALVAGGVSGLLVMLAVVAALVAVFAPESEEDPPARLPDRPARWTAFAPKVDVFRLPTQQTVHGDFGPGGSVVAWTRGERGFWIWEGQGKAERVPTPRGVRFLTVSQGPDRGQAMLVLDPDEKFDTNFYGTQDLRSWDWKAVLWPTRWDFVALAPDLTLLLEASNFCDRIRVKYLPDELDTLEVGTLRFTHDVVPEAKGWARRDVALSWDRGSEQPEGLPDRVVHAKNTIVAATISEKGSRPPSLCVWRRSDGEPFTKTAHPVFPDGSSREPDRILHLEAPCDAIGLDALGERCAVALANGDVVLWRLQGDRAKVPCGRAPERARHVVFVDGETFAVVTPRRILFRSVSGEDLGSLAWPEQGPGLRRLRVLGDRALVSAAGRIERYALADLRAAANSPTKAQRLWKGRGPLARTWQVERSDDGVVLEARPIGNDRLLTWGGKVTPEWLEQGNKIGPVLRLWDRKSGELLHGFPQLKDPWVDFALPLDEETLLLALPYGFGLTFATVPLGGGPKRELGIRAPDVGLEMCKRMVRLPDGRVAVGTAVMDRKTYRVVAGNLYLLDPAKKGELRRTPEVELGVNDLLVVGDRLVVSSGLELDVDTDLGGAGLTRRSHSGAVQFFSCGADGLTLEGRGIEHPVPLSALAFWPRTNDLFVLDVRQGLFRVDTGNRALQPALERYYRGKVRSLNNTRMSAFLSTQPRDLQVVGDRLLALGQGELQFWSLSKAAPEHLLTLRGLTDTLTHDEFEYSAGLAAVYVAGGELILVHEGFPTRRPRIEIWPSAILAGRSDEALPFADYLDSFRSEPDPSGD